MNSTCEVCGHYIEAPFGVRKYKCDKCFQRGKRYEELLSMSNEEQKEVFMKENSITPEQKLAALVDLIADKELKFGCEVILYGAKRRKVAEHWSDGKIRVERYLKTKWGKSEYEILGTPPDLTRVLWWIINKVETHTFCINRDGELVVCPKTVKEIPAYCRNKWDLSKSLLRDQSEEVISFLYDLLITK